MSWKSRGWDEKEKSLATPSDAHLNTLFTIMVDELVEFSEHDPDLAAGLKWIDTEAQRRGMGFYEMVLHVLTRYDADERAREWVKGLARKTD